MLRMAHSPLTPVQERLLAPSHAAVRLFHSDTKRSMSVPRSPPQRSKPVKTAASATGIAPSPLSRSSSDCFEILGLPTHADNKAIKSAYRQLARQYHPDVNRSESAALAFIEVRSAYENALLFNSGQAAVKQQSSQSHKSRTSGSARRKTRTKDDWDLFWDDMLTSEPRKPRQRRSEN